MSSFKLIIKNIKGIVKSFYKKNRKKKVFCDCNLSGIKLYINVAILRKK